MTDMLDTDRLPQPHTRTDATPTATGSPTIPTQRVELPTPAAPAEPVAQPLPVELPTQRQGAPAAATEVQEAPRPTRSDLRAPEAPSRRPVLRTVLVSASIVVLLGALVGGLVLKAQADARAAELARAQARVAAVVAAHAQDVAFQSATDQRLQVAAGTAVHDTAYAQAVAATEHATATLAATPQAGDAPRAAVQQSMDAIAAAVAAGELNPAGVRTLVAGLAAPEKAATDAQVAWQAAEDARIAAEKAAAEKAAAEQAAAAAARRSTGTRSTSTRATTSSGTSSAGAAAAPAVSGVPAGGLVCQGAGGSGAGESSVGAIGEAINAYRASAGLPTLSVVRSGSLVQHAVTMANTGGIWHSGGDNIVGCSNGGLGSLMSGWKNSAPHNAQMLRTDVSTMYVGGASLNGFLFGAVLFK
ncbi:hypothetical protein [Cellulomonas soli]|uniref:Uncharacterized protein n=1 Tax=Cellulomonas soli TaxID=931535 RepID=A0A512PGQ9_9CELL|nr:hypothetical protein [Cellulomonas soli]NYI59589.1 hypothetical protein [Cellulomonas soli]GEP70380.1 hypothetical protein CSO01_30950 [Cellulomonas soli]